MEIENNINLQKYNTLKLASNAKHFGFIKTIQDIEKAIDYAEENNLKIFVLGDGSNIILSNLDDYLTIKINIFGKEILEEDDDSVLVKVGAGENWDDFVDFAVENNYSGIEALSAIPGTVGAAPIQNIGAYGCEAKETISEVEVFDTEDKELKVLKSEHCGFGYRDSIFKSQNKGQYIIVGVTFKLNKKAEVKIPNYPGVKENLSENPTLKEVRDTIIKIRHSKLPNPDDIPNVGSFFKSPFVNSEKLNELKKDNSEIKYFESRDKYKIPAGWLVEHAGLKGISRGHFGTHSDHALVVTHDGEGTFGELEEFVGFIKKIVKDKFGIELEREPIIIK